MVVRALVRVELRICGAGEHSGCCERRTHFEHLILTATTQLEEDQRYSARFQISIFSSRGELLMKSTRVKLFTILGRSSYLDSNRGEQPRYLQRKLMAGPVSSCSVHWIRDLQGRGNGVEK